MMRRYIAAMLAAALLGTFAAGIALAKAGPLPADLQAVRAAVARYHNVNHALRDGYSLAGEPCVVEAPGTMGYHAVNRSLTADLSSDPLQPEILLYVPRGDGYELVGVEYFQVALANTATGPAPWFLPTPPPDGFFNPAPTIFGRAFDGPMPGHNPEMPWHYDIHVWLFEANPLGQFAPFNPALEC
jgi:hypothetical protein